MQCPINQSLNNHLKAVEETDALERYIDREAREIARKFEASCDTFGGALKFVTEYSELYDLEHVFASIIANAMQGERFDPRKLIAAFADKAARKDLENRSIAELEHRD